MSFRVRPIPGTDLFRHPPDLHEQLGALLNQLPRGRVTTYGTLAEALGNKIASRWVGQVLLSHQHTAACACHRVVRAGGELGGYRSSDPSDKARRLRQEGVRVVRGRIDLDRYGCDRFVSAQPLAQLRSLQEQTLHRLSLQPPARLPQRVAGVDVSYASDSVGVAAYCLIDVPSGELLWSTTVRRAVPFPYITSYLAFRELPILLKLWEQVQAAGRIAEVLLVDGSGIMHPRRAGIATMLGIVADVPTIGVTKKRLCGQVDLAALRCGEPRPVSEQDELLGVALLPRPGTGRPLFVSPGHRVDVTFAAAVVQRVLCGHRLPEPIYWADRLSRQAATST